MSGLTDGGPSRTVALTGRKNTAKGGSFMLRSELVEALAERNKNLPATDVEKAVDVILEEIAKALERGDRVELRGFGAFSVRKRDARVGRNPRTGTTVQVEAKRVPFFRAGKEIRQKLNGGRDD